MKEVHKNNTETPVMPAVDMRGICKSFGGVKALIDVDFELRTGEIHALLGGNGAGKSTILKVLNGVHAPDKGQVEINGKSVTHFSPQSAREAGVAMIYQEMSLVPTLTVAQNVFLNREKKKALGFIDDLAAEAKAKELFDLLGVDVNPKVRVGELGAGQKQLTEIVKAISQDARILILDEPSTALSVEDVDRLFAFLIKLKEEGVSIVYVSHRMDEIARIADRATIFRDGRHVLTEDIAALTMDAMIEHIVGKKSFSQGDVLFEDLQQGSTLLELKNASGKYKPKNLNLKLAKGEVVGLAGLLGSGRSSVARMLFGLEPMESGEMSINGRPIHITKPQQAMDQGIALVPESRATQGIIIDHSITSNLSLPTLDDISTLTLLNQTEEQRRAADQISQLSIKAASALSAVSTLSGGNQQKVVIGKWLILDPDLLILDEPTAGIDIGSKSEIIVLIRTLAKAGKTILMISSELSELLTACDRFIVMSNGEIAGEYPRSEFFNQSDIKSCTPHQLQTAEQKLQRIIQQALTEMRSE